MQILVLLIALLAYGANGNDLTIHAVTYNVNDKPVSGGEAASDKDIKDAASGQFDILIVSLQEVLGSATDIASGLYNLVGKEQYEAVDKKSYFWDGADGTALGAHGRSGVQVFVKKGLVVSEFQSDSHPCEGVYVAKPKGMFGGLKSTMKMISHKLKAAFNHEKGSRAVSFKIGDKKICVTGGHYPAGKEAKHRRTCLSDGLARFDGGICEGAHSTFMLGDFNWRTDDERDVQPLNLRAQTQQKEAISVAELILHDELNGENAYKGDYVSTKTDNEKIRREKSALSFLQEKGIPLLQTLADSLRTDAIPMPSYSVKCPDPNELAPPYSKVTCVDPPAENKGQCLNNKKVCYRADRPMSWADRVIFAGSTPGNLPQVVTSLQTVSTATGSDHFPAFATFKVFYEIPK